MPGTLDASEMGYQLLWYWLQMVVNHHMEAQLELLTAEPYFLPLTVMFILLADY